MLWMDSLQGHIEQDRSAREHSGYTSMSARFAQVYSRRSPVAALENSCGGDRSAGKFRGRVKLTCTVPVCGRGPVAALENW